MFSAYVRPFFLLFSFVGIVKELECCKNCIRITKSLCIIYKICFQILLDLGNGVYLATTVIIIGCCDRYISRNIISKVCHYATKPDILCYPIWKPFTVYEFNIGYLESRYLHTPIPTPKKGKILYMYWNIIPLVMHRWVEPLSYTLHQIICYISFQVNLHLMCSYRKLIKLLTAM